MFDPYIEDSGVIIGGAHDGEVRFVEDITVSFLELLVYEPVPSFPMYGGMIEESLLPRPTIKKEVYRKEILRGRESTFSFWVHQDLSIDKAMELLLKGYKSG